MSTSLQKKRIPCLECGGAHSSGELTEGLCPIALFDLSEGDVNASEAVLFGAKHREPLPSEGASDKSESGTRAADGGSTRVSLLAIPGYTVGSELARGGMGIVYRARQHAPDREVALKMLLPFSAALPELRERFQLEVRTLADLDHPAILPIYETGHYEELPWFSMKLATGGSLATRMAMFSGRWRDIAELIATLSDAAHFAHERGVLHRDLKPGNILFDAEARPFVADFGLAKLMGEETDFTRTQRAMGTPRYLAPEVAAGSARHATTASDVYSLGAILFELLTGRAPFEAEGLPALLGRIVGEEARFPTQSDRAKIPSDLQVIAIKCLAKNPAHRYASARELAEELRRFLTGKPIHARPASPAEKAWRWARREPALASALAACVFILVVGAAGMLRQLRETEAARAVAVQKADDEQAQRALAEKAQSEAEQSELVMRENLYAADMLAAQRALAEHDLGSARLLLDAHHPPIGQTDLRGFEWRYFSGKARGQSFAALQPSAAVVTAVNFSPDGSHVAIGAWQTFLYNLPSLELREKIETPNIQSVSFVPGSDSLILGMRAPSVVRRWNPGDKGLPSELFDPKGRWPNVAVSPRGDVIAVGINADASGWPEGTTALYDLATSALRQTLPQSGGMVRFSPDGNLLATGSWEGAIKLWNPSTGELVNTLAGARHVVTLRFSPDAQSLVACTSERGVLLYNLGTGTPRQIAVGHTGPVYDAEISPDGRLLATCSADQSVRVWDIESGQQKAELRGHSYTVSHVAWSPDGKILASGGHDGARFWDVAAAEAVEQPLNGVVRKSFFSPDGRWLAVMNPKTGVGLHEYPSLQADGGSARATGTALRFSADSKELLTLVEREKATAQVMRWTVPEMKLISTVELPDNTEPLIVPELTPDGRSLIAGIAPDQMLFWDLEKNVLARRTAVNLPGVRQLRAIALSPSGRYLAYSYHDWPAIHLRDFTSETPSRGTTARHRGQVNRLVFSADERTLVSCDSDKYIKIWDVETKALRATLLGHRLSVLDVDLSPDGRTIASSSSDGTVRLWNVATRREVARFDGLGVTQRVTFAPDGDTLLLTSRGAPDQPPTTLVWRAPPLSELEAKPATKPEL